MDKGNYGFFGIKIDSDSLKFVFEYGENKREIYLDYLMASFTLDIICDQQHIKAYINGNEVFEVFVKRSDRSNKIGLIHGSGEGRVHFQNFYQIGI